MGRCTMCTYNLHTANCFVMFQIKCRYWEEKKRVGSSLGPLKIDVIFIFLRYIVPGIVFANLELWLQPYFSHLIKSWWKRKVMHSIRIRKLEENKNNLLLRALCFTGIPIFEEKTFIAISNSSDACQLKWNFLWNTVDTRISTNCTSYSLYFQITKDEYTKTKCHTKNYGKKRRVTEKKVS